MDPEKKLLNLSDQLSPNLAEYCRSILFIYEELVAKQKGKKSAKDENIK